MSDDAAAPEPAQEAREPSAEPPAEEPQGRFTPQGKRVIVYLLIGLAVVAYFRLPRPFFVERELETEHFRIESRATEAQTKRLGEAAEILYAAYTKRFGSLKGFKTKHHRLHLRVYKNKTDFKRINPGAGWAEAFYMPATQTCHQYVAPGPSPFQWALHEIVHQLNHEVAGLDLAKWLEEGSAEYFAVSHIIDGTLELGTVDSKAYPIWWLPDLKLTGDRAADVKALQWIPLKAIVTNSGGPSVDDHFNTYYMHWWGLVHFLHHGADGRYAKAVDALMQEGGGEGPFVKHVGPFEEIEPLFYEYLRGYAAQGPKWKAIREPLRRPGAWPTWPKRTKAKIPPKAKTTAKTAKTG